MTKLDLAPKHRLHLAVHNLAARLHLADLSPVTVVPEAGHYRVTSQGQSLAVPSARRWIMYRHGYARRFDLLGRQFGLGSIVNLAPGDTVIDVGANVGEFGLRAAADGARVFCIEGDPKVFDCLMLNIAAAPGIVPLREVVWKAEEDLTFYSEPSHADSSIIADNSSGRYAPITLRATTLDLLATAQGIGPVALLKCDAEGAEPEVLQGATALLARTAVVALDTGPERLGQETGRDCAAILTAAGFTVTHEIGNRRKITIGRRTA